ncbi:MAG: GntR family transcriptional regulator [Kiloniellaceae bacterium]
MTQQLANQLAKTYERSRVPLYLQVAATLRRRIEDGYWRPGDKISTLEELESEFQVARVTVRQAIDVLQQEGLVQRQQGKGTFVAQTIRNKRWLRLETDWDSLIATIRDNVPRILPVQAPPPQPRLGPGDGTPAPAYEYLRSLQSRNNEPYALASVHVAKHVFDRDPKAFRTRTALSVLSSMKGIGIARAHQTLVIGAADMETADHLKLALNAPTAEAHCVVVDDNDVAIYLGDIIYRGDCVKLDIALLGGTP